MQEPEKPDNRNPGKPQISRVGFLAFAAATLVLLVAIVAAIVLNQSDSSTCTYSGTFSNASTTPDSNATYFIAGDCNQSSETNFVMWVFSWPVCLAGFLGIVGGLLMRRKWPLYFGAVLAIPSCFYLAAAPITFWIPISFPFFLIWAADLIVRGETLRAYLIAMPALLVLALFSTVMFFANLF